jgi:acyl dehydratase
MADPNGPDTPQETKAIGHRTVTEASIMTFGGLTGDYAQMHFDLSFGPAAGMEGTIAHGLLTGAWSLGALAQHAPGRLGIGDPAAFIAGYRVKFGRMVFIGDLFSLRWSESSKACVDGLAEHDRIDTDFEIVNQRGEVTTSGSVSVCPGNTKGIGQPMPTAPDRLEIEDWSSDQTPTPIFANDLVEKGPRGESLGRTVTEADLVAYTNFTGELSPAYLNEVFARSGRFGARIAPPMWTFCVGFGDYLRDLLSVSMPSSGFAGHLGDSWRYLGPVYVGDTLRTRHRPMSFKPSKSRPGMAVVEFALEIVNQRNEIVQDGQVAMMMTSRGEH